MYKNPNFYLIFQAIKAINGIKLCTLCFFNKKKKLAQLYENSFQTNKKIYDDLERWSLWTMRVNVLPRLL